jgi:hypothetical protein
MDYNKCMKSPKKPTKLCKRGYCTAKSKFKVYPSAYANGYASQVCAGKKPDFKGVVKKDYAGKKPSKSELSRWYKEDWVDVCTKDKKGNYAECGRSVAELKKKDYPYCRPLHKLPGTTVKTAGELTEKQRKKMCKKKKSIKPGVDGKPTRVYLKKQKGSGYANSSGSGYANSSGSGYANSSSVFQTGGFFMVCY